MPALARITVYPTKSLDGVEVPSAALLPAGPLEEDRRYAILDRDGQVINGKRTPAVHRIRAVYTSDFSAVHLSTHEDAPPAATFQLPAGREPLAAWLAEALGTPCTVEENTETAFPDDTFSPGPTIISTGTLEQIAHWFALPVDEARLRLRPNLEIDAAEPFWEDRLFGPSPQRPVRFTIGSVRFYGINPCERCVVPTRDAQSGDATPGFAKRLAEFREQSLPPWSPREAFDHFYRVMLNTRVAPGQDDNLMIQVGDQVVPL